MRYWDTSALIPLFIEETQSPQVRELLKQDPGRISWWGAPVECYSGLGRLRKMGCFSDDDLKRVRDRCDLMMGEIDWVAPSRFLRDRAMRLAILHPLRAGDSLHLASALLWCNDRPSHAEFVCLDEKLRTAAVREGFTVLP